ncbi:serine/threonine dehydratase [Actinocatenispora thailandica]|uniref:threonine ammonia-lyase n=1 Tax=Actinocatenispora thailandica TaxID=227318 RepID=A0A7R7DJA4_9ACTN|nr:threonine/serine dehydratase [Actinocatenispora thailandica]BCJ32521.1 serine/threonine dehydratase [Actinocatenispora thailandica]
MELVTIDDIRAAAEVLTGVAVRTPLLPQPWAQPGRQLWLKPENLQPVGAFKLRGAYHAIAVLPDEARKAGVVTHSSGNHGRAVAYAAAVFGVPAVVVIPDVAPPIKIEAVRELGAEVVLVPGGERADATARIAAERGMTVIPPFDHRDVIAGQGTVGLEILADAADADLVLVQVGGGGLASGVSTAIKALSPRTAVYGVEPAVAPDARDSLAAGRLVPYPDEQRYATIADGMRTGLSELTLAHLTAHLDGIVTVAEDEIRDAVGVLARQANLVAEPSGATTLAAYLHHADELPAGRTVAVVSGGNLDPAQLATLVRG